MRSSTCSLLLERTSPADIKMRDLYFQVDDLREFTLLFGERRQIELEPGEHRVRATNRLFSKVASFELSEGEAARFEAANVPGGCWFAPLMVISGTGAYKVAIRRVE